MYGFKVFPAEMESLGNVIIKVEKDVEGLEESIDMKSEEVYVPSAVAIKTEPENCADVLDAESGSRNWTCPASHDENQDIDVKVEVVTDIQEEEDPLLITIPVTRAEHE